MKDDRLLKLGQKIRYERLKRGISQEDLEEKSGVSRRAISEIERGNTDIRYTNLYQIAQAFGLNLHELLNFQL
ncbi:helix-turn-helix transcriptional regulator [bacterium]|nr:helix-turn-helix transcriptional regulator [bacterium]